MDAGGESEQATAFLTVLEEHLALPFRATVLGEAVVVEKIDLSGADELIATCRRRGKRQKVSPSGVTVHHRSWSLVVSLKFTDAATAAHVERYLKTGSGRAFAKRHFGGKKA